MNAKAAGCRCRNNKTSRNSWRSAGLMRNVKKHRTMFSKLSAHRNTDASSQWSMQLVAFACALLTINGQRFESISDYDDEFGREKFVLFAVAGHYFNRSLVEELKAFDSRVLSDGDVVKIHFPKHNFLGSEWLIYLPRHATLEGVPLLVHVGSNNFYVTVDVVHDNVSSQSSLTLPCTVEVLTEEDAIEMHWKSSRYPKLKIDAPTACSYHDPVTIATISIEAEFQDFSHLDRLNCVRNFVNFFNVPANDVTFHFSDSMKPGRVILSGSGNVPKARTRNATAALSWAIGCNSDIIGDISYLDSLETSVVNGSLARVIGHNVSEWRIVNRAQNFHKKTQRIRRKAGTIPSSANMFYPPASKLPIRRDSGQKTMNIPRAEETVATFRNGRTRIAVNAIRATPVPDVPIMAAKVSLSPMRRPVHGFQLSTPSVRPPVSTPSPTPKDNDLPPMMLFGMEHVNARKGTYMQLRIPNDVFYDSEDKMTWNLKLNLVDATTNDKIPDGKSWVMFDADSQLLYGVPDNNAVKEREFALYATDSTGQSASVTFYIRVDLSDAPEPASHKFTFYFSKSPNLKLDVALYRAFGRKLTFGMARTEQMPGQFVMVDTGIAQSTGQRFITWFDRSLSRKDLCHSKGIKDEAEVMIGEDAKAGHNRPVREFAIKFRPEFELNTIKIELLGPCFEHTTTTTTTTHFATTGSVASVVTSSISFPTGPISPVIPKQATTSVLAIPSPPQFGTSLPVLIAQVGEMSYFTLPSGSFVDPKSAENDLEIMLLAGAPSWVALNPETRTIYFIPTREDVVALYSHNSTYKTWTGGFVTKNGNGAMSQPLAFEVLIQQQRSGADQKANHLFSIVIGNYNVKNFTALDQVRLIRTIVNAFGDEDSRKLYFYPIRKGSIVFSWHNSSLAYITPCPFGKIAALAAVVFDGKKFKTKARETFRTAGFTIESISLAKTSWCIAGEEAMDSDPTEEGRGNDVVIAGRQGKSTIIVITVIALCLVVLVVTLAVKCRMGQASKSEENKEKAKLARQKDAPSQNPSDRTRIKKGVPIVFQDEIDWKAVTPMTPSASRKNNADMRSPAVAKCDEQILEESLFTRPHPRYPLTPPTPIMSNRPPPPYVKSR